MQSPSMRGIAPLALIALAVPRPALGQLCHPSAPAPTSTVDVAIAAEATALDGGDVQGLSPSLRWQGQRYGARLVAPAYRLADDRGGVAVGLGDVVAELSARLVGDEPWRAGVVAGVALPTGDDDNGLGMGHTMVMPAVWASASLGPLRIATTASFGASLGDAGAHATHHQHSMPQVNPMNAREVAGSLRAGYLAASSLELHGTVLAAVPVGDGLTRAVVGGGVSWNQGAWRLDARTDAGAAGRPFVSRGMLELTRSF